MGYTDYQLKVARKRANQVMKLARAVLREQEMRDVELDVVANIVSRELSLLRDCGEIWSGNSNIQPEIQ